MHVMKIEDICKELPSLETNRTLLRKLSLDDADDIFEYASEPEIAQYVPWEYHRSIEDTLTFLNSVIEKYRQNQNAEWGIVLKDNNKLIGSIGFHWWSIEHASAEIGYALSKQYWGHGIMSEVLHEVIRFGFSNMKLNRIEARTRVENTASQNVLKRAGMTYEGTIREQFFTKGEYRDFMMYSILRKEYNKR